LSLELNLETLLKSCFLSIFELLNVKKMTFSVTILGNASAMPTKRHFPTAQVLNIHERLFLIDCGEGAQMQLQQCGLSFMKIGAAFISHLHGDHLFGLFGLLSTMSMLGRRGEFPIYAPDGLQQILADHLKYFGAEMQYTPVVHSIDTAQPALIYENKAMTVHSIPLKHRVQAAGFLFRERTPQLNVHKDMIGKYNLSFPEIIQLKRGEDVLRDNGAVISAAETTYLPYQPRAYAFCSDTAFSEEVIAAVRGVDLLYHEATFQNDRRDLAIETCHSTAADAANVAKAAKVKKLLIGHFSSRYTNENGFLQEAQAIFPNTEIAEQLSVFEVK
jgi:ribonuclease Z